MSNLELFLSLLGIALALPPIFVSFLIPWLRRNLKQYIDYTRAVESNIETFSEVEIGLSRLHRRIENEKFDAIISFDRGGAIVGGYLAKVTGLPLLYIRRAQTGSEPIACFLPDDVRGKSILLVDDAYRSGSSMRRAHAVVMQSQPQMIKTLALLNTIPRYNYHQQLLPLDFYAYFTKMITLKLPWDKNERIETPRG